MNNDGEEKRRPHACVSSCKSYDRHSIKSATDLRRSLDHPCQACSHAFSNRERVTCNDFSLLPMFNVFLMQKMKRKGEEGERKELIAAINSPLLSFQLHECREYLKKKINNESFIVLMDSIVAAFNVIKRNEGKASIN